MNRLGEKSLKTLEYYEIRVRGGKGEVPRAPAAG